MFGSANQYAQKGKVEKIVLSIEQKLRSAGNNNLTTKVFEGANHEPSNHQIIRFSNHLSFCPVNFNGMLCSI